MGACSTRPCSDWLFGAFMDISVLRLLMWFLVSIRSGSTRRVLRVICVLRSLLHTRISGGLGTLCSCLVKWLSSACMASVLSLICWSDSIDGSILHRIIMSV